MKKITTGYLRLLHTVYINTQYHKTKLVLAKNIKWNYTSQYTGHLFHMHTSLLNINLIKANRTVFISPISTDPQLNIVSSGSVTIVSVKPWDTRNITTR